MTRIHRLFVLAGALAFAGCGFTGEPDPGGVADLSDSGLPAPNLDAAASDVGGGADAQAGEPDQAPEPPPADAFADADAAVFDAAFDSELDAGPPDGTFDADLPDGGQRPDAVPDGGELLDGGPPTPEEHCDVACTAIVTCGPGPDPAECRRECLAEDDDAPGTAARLDACVQAHIADGRCDIAALQICMSDAPLPLDPHCVLACDGLGACPDLPARPDCAETCTEEPGPERQRLQRCVEAHVADGRCDGLGFLECGGQPPAAADDCRFLCTTQMACDGDDAPLDDCLDACLADDPATRRADVDCAALHLDRSRCDGDAFGACRGP